MKIIVVVKVKYIFEGIEELDQYYTIVNNMEELYKDIHSRYGNDIVSLKIATADNIVDDVIYVDVLPELKRLMDSL